MDSLGGVPEFDTKGDPTSVRQRWLRWKRALELFIVARGVKDDAQKLALMLHCGGMKLQDVYFTLVKPEDDVKYVDAVKLLGDHFTPQSNVPFERHLFRKLEQAPDESVNQFVCRLREKAVNCDFTDSDEAIRDQLIDKCRDPKLRKKFLEKTGTVKLKDLLDSARAHEAVEQQLRQMSLKDTSSCEQINAVGKPRSASAYKQYGKEPKDSPKGNPCYRCGKVGHFGRDESCPARGVTCRKCGLKDHYDSCCRTRKMQNYQNRDQNNYKSKTAHVKYTSDESEYTLGATADYESSEDDKYAFRVGDNSKQRDSLVITIGDVKSRVTIDSGATVNVMGRGTWRDMKSQNIKCKSTTNPKTVYGYGSKEPLPTIGTFTAKVTAGSRESECEFVVVDRNAETLLSRKTSEALGLLKIGYNVNAVTPQFDDAYRQEVKQRFPGIGDGVGKRVDRQINLHIDSQVRPVAQPLRRVPYSQKSKVEAKIWELLDEDIIEPATGPTTWVNPVVVVPKSNGDDIRLCIDMRRANEAITRERHPIPTAEEVLQEMAGAKYFSKIDLKQGYHQLELDPDSRDVTTFVTHVGLFRYKRLMFGINAASEIFQHEVQKVIQGIPGVRNISDDIGVSGRTKPEHDERLWEVLRRLHKAGFTINLTKCLFGVPEMTFFGYKVSRDGVDIEAQKVKAVLEAREPETATEVRSFLGLVNFSARFIPDLSTIAEPLRQLTRNDVPFEFDKKERDAFNKLKQAITSADTLAFYDPQAKTQVVADASPVGLGAVLIQDSGHGPRVVSYASRSLSDVERRYSQTEKEALGLVWACEKFHIYVYGTEFDLITDHKPLQAIYSPRSKPCARVERWVLRLQPYTYKVIHIPGKQNIADSLSRLMAANQKADGNLSKAAERYVRAVTQIATPGAMTTREVEEASHDDPELISLRECLESGMWDKCPYKEYVAINQELCKIGYIVLRGTRIIVPKKLRARTLELAHEGHLGIVGTKQTLRSKVWWPKMYQEVEKFCRSCHGCQLVSKPAPPEPICSTELPPGPWQDLALDFLGPLPTGESILVVVDYYSRFYEIAIMKSTTSTKTIAVLREMFARHGLPRTLRTDNGPQLVSNEFEEYLEQEGILHIHTTPKWAQANGEVERQNQSIEKRLRIAHAEGRNWRNELLTYLAAYRATPHATTGASPAKLLYGRELRTKLPNLSDMSDDQEVRDHDADRKGASKLYADRRRHATHSDLRPGEEVLVRTEQYDKLSTPFHPTPFRVVARNGSQVTVQSPAGVRYKRNVTAVKRYVRNPQEPSSMVQDQTVLKPPEPPDEPNILAEPEPPPDGAMPEPSASESMPATPETAPAADLPNRPSRNISMPKRYDDYLMY